MDYLKTIDVHELKLASRDPVDPKAFRIAAEVVEEVRAGGEAALRRYAERFGEVPAGGRLFYSPEDLRQSLAEISQEERALLERVAERIRAFALAQRGSLGEFEIEVPGGRALQRVAPVERAGCYAPGGRFPLPSSVLMTAVTARAAGVSEVWVASPRPTPVTLAAAAVAGADGLLAAGGAQAIAAMAFGAGSVPACDMIAGPGNKFVTAAKKIVSGTVGIDMLAGPSELVVLADGSADAGLIAADLLAQAEHDPDAVPMLVSLDSSLAARVNEEIRNQLGELPTAETARESLKNGFAVVARDEDEAVRICDLIAPEHLEIQTEDAQRLAGRLRNYGALFIGEGAAEVLGDYGAGPNHTLPTGGGARHCGGLSVMDFVRVRTWLTVGDRAAATGIFEDAARLGEIEGLAAHARSARMRLKR